MTEIDTDKLVERLRRYGGSAFPDEDKSRREETCIEAADAILAMAEDNQRLKEALEPFARIADPLQACYSRPLSDDLLPSPCIPLSAYRAARGAYALGGDKA